MLGDNRYRKMMKGSVPEELKLRTWQAMQQEALRQKAAQQKGAEIPDASIEDGCPYQASGSA
ncbi:hypothetical protein DXA96_06525 [Lachnospiraceae bacterium OF09-33XD]|nr:hypothetical protein DXA96_06525 [Lachnospiraceae bacterium OF09-33XD]